MAHHLLINPRGAACMRFSRLLCINAAPTAAPAAESDERAVVHSAGQTDVMTRPHYRSRGADPEYQSAAQELRKRLLMSKRRVRASPMLRLEKVAMCGDTQRAIESALAESGLGRRELRQASRRGETARASQSREKRLARKKSGGPPLVLPPPEYDHHECARSYAAIRAPGTLAANVHVLSELRRLRPDFLPKSLLDFGAGIGVALSATSRVFQTPVNDHSDNVENSSSLTTLQRATLVEKSDEMRALGAPIAAADMNLSGADVEVNWVSSIREAGKSKEGEGYSLVVASYALVEIAKNAIVSKSDEDAESGRDARMRRAEKQLRAVVKMLWSRTRPGGHLVIVEDGTSAGFETVLFARETIRMTGDARVVAPCLHSHGCPLDGTVNRHRVCRFVQRLNRPLFLRVAKPMPDGFEDEYFSYVVMEKTAESQPLDAVSSEESWGRLVRAPLRRGKHVIFDACLKNGTLERRTVSKKSAQPGMYNVARKAKWGDVWPLEPESAPQKVRF